MTMPDPANPVAGKYQVLNAISPVTVTGRALSSTLASIAPLPAWLVIGPVMWALAGNAPQPTPIWPLPARETIVADIPAFRALVGEQGVWMPLIIGSHCLGGLLLSSDMPERAELREPLTVLVAAIYYRQLASRQAIWQHLLSQMKARYEAGEDGETILSDALGDRIQTTSARGRPLWPDEAHTVELARSVVHPALTSNRVLGLAAAGVAHDMNNLLTVILGRAQLLELDANDEQLADLQVIEAAAELGASSARRLQRLAHPGEAMMQPVDLVSIAQAAIEQAQQTLRPGRNAQIVAELPLLPPVRGEARLLRQALASLLIATAEMLPVDSLIRVSGGADDQHVWIEIIDPGLPPSLELDAASIQTRRAHTLELAIARQTSRLHGGNVRSEAHSSGGTITQFILPRLPVTNGVSNASMDNS